MMLEFWLDFVKLDQMGIVVVGLLGGFHVGWCLRIVRLGGLLEMLWWEGCNFGIESFDSFAIGS
jgi:hypothetical protein